MRLFKKPWRNCVRATGNTKCILARTILLDIEHIKRVKCKKPWEEISGLLKRVIRILLPCCGAIGNSVVVGSIGIGRINRYRTPTRMPISCNCTAPGGLCASLSSLKWSPYNIRVVRNSLSNLPRNQWNRPITYISLQDCESNVNTCIDQPKLQLLTHSNKTAFVNKDAIFIKQDEFFFFF